MHIPYNTMQHWTPCKLQVFQLFYPQLIHFHHHPSGNCELGVTGAEAFLTRPLILSPNSQDLRWFKHLRIKGILTAYTDLNI